MKKISILPLLFVAYGAAAQTVDEAESLIYHARYDNAAQTLQNVIEKEPENAEAYYWQTAAYLQQDKPEAVKQALITAPATVKGTPLYRVAYGQLLLNEAKKDSAAFYFEQAMKETREKDAFVLAGIARAHIEAKDGDPNYALQILEKAIKRDKRNPALYTLKGDAYLKLQNGSEAFKAYQEALDKDKAYAAAMYKLGNIFASQKNEELYLQYYNDALKADPAFAPAYYALYYHYYFTDVAKAMEYYKQYMQHTDKSLQTEYAYTDLLYLNKQYNEAIQNANTLIGKEGTDAEPRLYKLIAYSYRDQQDTAKAYEYMTTYFAKAPDSAHVIKDYETMAQLYQSQGGSPDSVAAYYAKALTLVTDSAARYDYFKKLAKLNADQKNHSAEAMYLGQYYNGNEDATNIDLFNWGLAHFKAAEYTAADSVFGLYTEKYPEQTFGYYWRARSNMARENAMEEGYAIPHYQKLLEVAEKDLANETNKKWAIEAYGYLAAYETNTNKAYAQAIEYFKKLLELDPENADAAKYITILQKNLGSGDTSKASE
ncbi:MAG: tetratricopeptide repeat protein [Chitinophagaceae bacterium]